MGIHANALANVQGIAIETPCDPAMKQIYDCWSMPELTKLARCKKRTEGRYPRWIQNELDVFFTYKSSGNTNAPVGLHMNIYSKDSYLFVWLRDNIKPLIDQALGFRGSLSGDRPSYYVWSEQNGIDFNKIVNLVVPKLRQALKTIR